MAAATPMSRRPTANVVVATADIPLGVRIQAEDVKVDGQGHRRRAAVPGYFSESSQVIGKVVRAAGHRRPADHRRRPSVDGGTITDINCPALRVCMAVQVDQVPASARSSRPATTSTWSWASPARKFPVITLNPPDDSFTVVSGLNSTSVKALLQGLQVMGTLLPPPPAEDPERALTPEWRYQHGPQRSAADRHPVGRHPAVRGHQVRPAGRLDQPGPALAGRLHRPGHRRADPRPSRRSPPPASSSRPSSTPTASCRRSSSRPSCPHRSPNP